MNRVKELYEMQSVKQKELDALLILPSLSGDQKEQLRGLNGELKTLDADIAQAEERAEMEAASASRKERMQKTVAALPYGGDGRGHEQMQSPALYRALRTSSVKNFENQEVMLADGSVKDMSATEQAERFGMWFIAKFSGPDKGERAKLYCREQKIGHEFLAPHLKVAYEGVNERGGLA